MNRDRAGKKKKGEIRMEFRKKLNERARRKARGDKYAACYACTV
jgi:hypothetical protein